MRTGISRWATASLALLALATPARAFPRFARATKAACAACHANPAGGLELTDAGKAFKADSTKVPAAGAAGAEYVGSTRCRMCHSAQAQSWATTPHAHAFEPLKAAHDAIVAAMARRLHAEVKGKASESEACVVCHVTGFQLAGGYPAADSTKNASLANVTCEACHGPGSRHLAAPISMKKKMINRAVTASLCTQCHTPAMSPGFNFEGFRKRGVHAMKARG